MRKKDHRNWYTNGNAISQYHGHFDLLIRVQSTWQPVVISLPFYQTKAETYLKYGTIDYIKKTRRLFIGPKQDMDILGLYLAKCFFA